MQALMRANAHVPVVTRAWLDACVEQQAQVRCGVLHSATRCMRQDTLHGALHAACSIAGCMRHCTRRSCAMQGNMQSASCV